MPDTRHKIANFNSPGPSEREGPRPVPSYDHIGNVVAVVDDTGIIVAAYEYEPFGNVVAQVGPEADGVPFRFSTKYFDPETGLYYYGYRFYAPLLGRWINRDMIEEDGGENLYAFCVNRVLNSFDVFGLAWTISRRGGNFALAEGVCDSINSLADIIGLPVGWYKEWTSPMSDPIPNSPYHTIPSIKLRIPNTIISYWAGDLGALGQWWVNYNESVNYLTDLGFRVNSLTHSRNVGGFSLQHRLTSGTFGKWLHGLYFWGHGYAPYPSQGLTNSSGEAMVDYSSISLSYKLGLTLLFACDSNSGMMSIASHSPGAIHGGFTGTLYPINPWGYRVSNYIMHGDQGTK